MPVSVLRAWTVRTKIECERDDSAFMPVKRTTSAAQHDSLQQKGDAPVDATTRAVPPWRMTSYTSDVLLT